MFNDSKASSFYVQEEFNMEEIALSNHLLH